MHAPTIPTYRFEIAAKPYTPQPIARVLLVEVHRAAARLPHLAHARE